MKSIMTLIAASGLLAVFAGSANADTLVYIVSGAVTGAGEFGTVDLNTGAFQQIGPFEPDGYFGLAPGPNGSLLSLTYAGNLDSINPATGVPTRIGGTGLASCVIPVPSCPPTSAFSLGGAFPGKIYATDFHNDLYIVNPTTGLATLLSDHTGLPPSPFVLGTQNADGTLNFADEAIWESGGKLYVTYDALIFNPVTFTETVVIAPALYQIDPGTGQATFIGPTDVGIGGGTSENGTSYVFNDLTNQIAAIDLSTGATSPAGIFDPSAGVIQGAVPAYSHPVLTSGTNCNGTYTGTFHGNVTVTNGQTCVLLGGGVTGNITLNSGSLSISNVVIGGNVQVRGGGAFSVGPSATIDGNLEVQNIPFGMTMNQVCDAIVMGNLQFQDNGAPVQIGPTPAAPSCLGNAIVGNLEVHNNTGLGSTAIYNNIVGGNLQDQNNTAPTQVFNNTVTWNLHCQNNSAITGGGNTAAQKQGQCALF